MTANTPANAGRQFYKCAHPSEGEACLKFQWADEAEGGAENNRAAANPPQGRFMHATGVALTCHMVAEVCVKEWRGDEGTTGLLQALCKPIMQIAVAMAA